MAIERNTNTDILFNSLMAAGCTLYGACAAMGNIYAESGANPRNLDNLCENKPGYKYTDATYTEAVDSGEITRDLFLHPLGDSRQYGYGFCQWTSAGRKAGLYDMVKTRGVSIGDARVQTEYMLSELKTSYKSVWKVLQTATTVQEASDIFLVKFEAPANTGSSVKKVRASYGDQYLKLYQKKEENKVSKIKNAVARAEAIALDDSHGYDQVDRWGNPNYDCSGLVISCLEDLHGSFLSHPVLFACVPVRSSPLLPVSGYVFPEAKNRKQRSQTAHRQQSIIPFAPPSFHAISSSSISAYFRHACSMTSRSVSISSKLFVGVPLARKIRS